jgi:hypothetical protein
MSRILKSFKKLAGGKTISEAIKHPFTDDDVSELITDLDRSHYLPSVQFMNKAHIKFTNQQRHRIAEKIMSLAQSEDPARVGIHALLLMSFKAITIHSPDSAALLADVFYGPNPESKGDSILKSQTLNENAFNLLNASIFIKTPLTREDFKSMFHLSGYMESALGIKTEKPMSNLTSLREKLDSNGLNYLSQALDFLAHGKPIELGESPSVSVGDKKSHRDHASESPGM